MLKPFLFGISFIFILASLLLKSWRITAIFDKNATVNVVQMSNRYLLKRLVLFTIVDVAISILWTILSSPSIEYVIDDDRARFDCQGSDDFIFSTVSTVYKTLLTGFAVVFAVKSRNVPSSFNEAKAIGFTTYNVGILGLIYLLLTAFVTSTPLIQIVIQAFTMCAALLATLVIILGPKIHVIYFRPDLNRTKSQVASSTGPKVASGGRISSVTPVPVTPSS